ncbi:hypothetical protein SAY87_029289 [Trapa incisa]|uniref:Endonuclease/exonuclease/phosphatase domain-containing protein n=1 Tax=Trapa incisa TaxID=236973 RepID=A0AAN7QCY7_9MYRT|nr:hypothetical protein SAY87_029289 [Trapa incisa]
MFQESLFKGHFLSNLRKNIRRVCSRLRWLIRKRPRLKVLIKRLRRFKPIVQHHQQPDHSGKTAAERPIRIATFNVAMFALAPAVTSFHDNKPSFFRLGVEKEEGAGHYPLKSILKRSPLNLGADNGTGMPPRLKMKVSINLPDNEISLANSKFLGLVQGEQKLSRIMFSRTGDNNDINSKVPVRSPVCFPYGMMNSLMKNIDDEEKDDLLLGEDYRKKSIFEVLREVNADVIGLQDVKAEEEKGMRPLSDLAQALGMHYVFAESWAPEYGNAILSRWPIKRWTTQKIADDDDFRNVLKATLEVPWAGELNFSCTQLDHLDEYWRMRQVGAIVQSCDPPDVLAGGLNSLEESDYSVERWMDIVRVKLPHHSFLLIHLSHSVFQDYDVCSLCLQYYEAIGKPTPKAEVMKFMNLKQYMDAKHFAGDCVPVVIIAKGQNVQGTCKYGTRVDYILGSPHSPFMFVPNSYTVVSSEGTSDHHIVKADIVRVVHFNKEGGNCSGKIKHLKQKVLNIGRYPCLVLAEGYSI